MKTIDIVILILAGTVCLVLLIAVMKDFFNPDLLGEEETGVISQVVLALIAIISLYVGSKLKSKD